MNIAIVGAGNVAWHLAQALQAADHSIVTVYSRTKEHSEALSQHLPGAVATQSLNFESIAVDVILIAIPDAVLTTIVSELKVHPGAIVAHTSGSQPASVLESIPGAGYGVFYPLQTFSKQALVDLKQVPILLEGNTQQTTTILQTLAQSISHQVEQVTSEKRKQLHLAAVFACNFTNHLLGVSQELLQKAGLPLNLLQPLIQETIKKASTHNPYTVQTGPAIRHDQNVIEEHLRQLASQPQFQEIYRLLTQSIQDKSAGK